MNGGLKVTHLNPADNPINLSEVWTETTPELQHC